MKVLIVGADSAPGGVFGYVCTLINNFETDCYEFHVALPGVPGRVGPRSAAFHNLPVKYGVISMLLRIYQLRKIISAHHIDLVHLHTARAGLLGVLAAAYLNLPVVYTGHSWRYEQKDSRLGKYLFRVYERFICDRATAVTFLTERDLNHGVKKRLLAASKASLIRTRIEDIGKQHDRARTRRDARRRYDVPPRSLTVGNVGHLSERKDPTTFVRTAAAIAKAIPEVFFLWIGDGVLRDRMEELAADLGIGDRLRITGFVPQDEVGKILPALDVFLFTSRFEGVPLSILEAQAARIPVVTAEYAGSGVEEVVADGQTGLTFPVGHVEAAAEAVVHLLTQLELRLRLAERARQSFEQLHCGPEAMAREFAEVYQYAVRSTQKEIARQ